MLNLVDQIGRSVRLLNQAFQKPFQFRTCAGVCTENFIRVDDAPESPKLAE